MDITTGAVGSADLLRAYLGAGPITEDATLQTCWDVAVDATQRWIRPGYTADAPAGVQEFVLAVAATLTAGEYDVRFDRPVAGCVAHATPAIGSPKPVGAVTVLQASAGVIIDAVRAAKIAMDRGIGGPILSAGTTKFSDKKLFAQVTWGFCAGWFIVSPSVGWAVRLVPRRFF